MGFNLRTIADNVKFPEAVSLNALEQAIPQATVAAVIVDLGVEEQRTRKLSAEMTLLLCIAMGLFTNIALTQVLRKLVKGVRYIWPGDEDYETANKSAISQARYRLGTRPNDASERFPWQIAPVRASVSPCRVPRGLLSGQTN